jgi:hypothetical protein
MRAGLQRLKRYRVGSVLFERSEMVGNEDP